MSDRTFGVEIEAFNLSYPAIKELVKGLGYKILETDCNYSVWNIKNDCTISPYIDRVYYGNRFELTTPILRGEDGLKELADVNQRLINNGMLVNNTCGLHVHVGAGDLTAEEIYTIATRYAYYENQIVQLIAPARRGYNRGGELSYLINNYAARNTSFKEQIDRRNYPGRYNLNLGVILSKGTIEFREFGAILDTECMINWVKFCVNFIDQTREIVGGKVDTGLYMGLDDSIADYFDQRAEFLSYHENAR